MYLKEIRAHGFKSFADPIKIDLEKGITGVVGPNGSGKSNVVDAIRWVLGEQSVKSLRGDGNMADVIFSGSKSRKASHVASVTLVFDNSDNYLPIKFQEVSVTRRVYQDGTNEYLLNNEKCRLKDITDLFIDSGVAKESFNIISQGKIDEIIATKPNERRVIFEEAAGVVKYRKRKEEALRKLDRTHDNMNRVGDIIKELEVQVEPLKKQKEQAINYLNIKEELEHIEIALLAHDISTMNETYQQEKQKIQKLNEEILNLSTSSNVSETKIEEEKLSLNKLEQELSTLQQQLLISIKEVEQASSQKQILLERKNYEVDDNKIHQQIVGLKEQEEHIQNEIASLTRTIEEKMNEALEKSKESLVKEEELQKIKQIQEQTKKDLSNSIMEQTRLNHQIERLKDSIENNSILPSSVRSILNHPTLSGIYDVLGNVLEMDDVYKTAISTVLGASASHLIVETSEDAKRAIRYLKEQNLGRATFYPLQVMRPKAIEPNILLNLKKVNGFVDVASNLVKYDPKYKNVILNQLGNVLIATNLDSAQILSRITQLRYRIITLDGQVINIGGSLTGGATFHFKNTITEKQELEESFKKQKKVEENIRSLENKINELDHQYQIIEDEKYLFKKEEVELQEIVNVKKRLKEEYLNQYQTVKSEQQGMNQLLDNSLSAEEEKAIETYYEKVRKKEELESNLKNLEQEKKTLQDSISLKEFEARKENSFFQAKSKELKELEINVNRYDVKLDHALTTLSENYNMTYEKAKKQGPLEMEVDRARNKVGELKRALKELGIVNLAAPDEYDRISTRYEFLLSQREDLVHAENTLLEIMRQLDEVMEKEFLETFKVIQENFNQTFKELFKGGYAELKLTNPDNILETGVEIIASPPGKKLNSISLLSGGEKTFTAISLLFAILKSRPVPFCILDEVEAALDEVNVDSFGNYLTTLQEKTQFILITHKKKTMEYAKVLYGITMQESGVSKLVSVRLEDLK